MGKNSNYEYFIFAILVLVALAATSYFVYRAAVKFDPYYNERADDGR